MNQTNREQIYRQVDGIFALEGFEPTEMIWKVRAAVDAGRITDEAFRQEFLDYVRIHKSTDGFIESRDWILR